MLQNFASHFLIHHLSAVGAAHPGIELELVTSSSFVDLARGNADIAVRFSPAGAGVPAEAGPVENPAMRLGVENAKSYFSNPDLKSKMMDAGVVGAPEITFTEAV